jgi:hypothetical protein
VSAAWLAAAHKYVPVVISRRVGYPIGKSRVARARYEAAACIVANSQWVADQAAASGVPRDKLTVVYEGTEIPSRLTPERRQAARTRWGISTDVPLLMSRALLKMRSGRCHVYSTSSCCFVKHLLV